MPVQWRTPIGEKYLDIEFIHSKIPRTTSTDSSMGWALRHPNTTFRYNPTVPAKTSLAVFTGLVNMMQNRWEFNVVKVEEWTEISPSHSYYQTITKQKHDLVRQVKEGLAQIDRAVSDTELLMHDRRRYKEILSYFEEKDEHSLKAMFIDQVDVNLPEGVSLRSIAPRWPTIIADFQELKDEDDTPEKIMKKIEVSKAEAVVLATKVRLYKKWKQYFGDEVKTRYKLIVQRVLGRKASIEEYSNWLRPLIRRVMQMREVDDSTLTMHYNFMIGSGMPVAFQYVEFWAWTRMEGLEPAEEPHRYPRETYITKGTGPRGSLGQSKGQMFAEPDSIPKFRVEPYDDVVKKLIPEIEKKHGVKITKEDVLEARRRLYTKGSPGTEWYVMMQIPAVIETFKLPNGLEVEDIDINPLSAIFLTHNMLLVRLLEIIAEEHKIDVYIDELLGKKVLTENGIVKELDELLKEEFPGTYGKKGEESAVFKTDIKDTLRIGLRDFLSKLREIFGLELGFIKLGPYNPMVLDQLFYHYGRPFYREVFGPRIWAYLLRNFGGV
jgi:hypothetical protein